MANDIQQVFESLANKLGNVSNALDTQGLGQFVQSFDGNEMEFQSWIKSIDKYALIKGLNDEKTKMVSYQTATGPISDFIFRFLNKNNNCTWVDLKTELTSKFSDYNDSQHAMNLLRHIKQNLGENIHMYAERLIQIAKDAFKGNNGDDLINSTLVQRQLIDYFVDGLIDDSLKIKVIRDAPVKLSAAITLTSREQTLRNRVNLRLNRDNKHCDEHNKPEAIKVRPQTSQIYCNYCRNTGHQIYECRKRIRHVQAIETRYSRNFNRGFNKTRWLYKNIKCWNCAQLGHIKRMCKNRPLTNNKHLN